MDTDNDLFALQNLSKNTILVDRQPLAKQESRPLYHKSLVQIADCMFFFLLPNETQEKRKRSLKERRKGLLEQVHMMHNTNGSGRPGGSSSRRETNESGQYPSSVAGLKGFGRRLNLKEMLMLHQWTRDEVKG